MSNEAVKWLILSGMFAGPVAAALSYAWLTRRSRRRQRIRPRGPWPRPRSRPSTLWDLQCMAEFQRRWRRLAKWAWGSWALAALALFALGLPMTAVALATLVPLSASFEHLRCPACETTATLRGLTDGRACLKCGTRLKY